MSREEYEEWEKRVILNFFVEGANLVLKRKSILFFFEEEVMGCLRRGEWSSLPEKKKVRLFHMGKGEEDSVSVGREGGTFKFAGTDTGGLTNVGLDSKKEARVLLFEGKKTAEEIYSFWLEVSGKRSFFPEEEVKGGLSNWVTSVLNLHPAAGFGVWFPEEEKRVILPAREVRDRVGDYFVRVFGGGTHARRPSEKELDSLFCGVAGKYVTPNLNEKNLKNEYVF